MITIRRFNLAHVVANDKKLFNSNNHGDEQPADYHDACDRSKTWKWVDKFHAKTSYATIRISDRPTVSWLKRAVEVGVHTGRVSNLYAEEVDELVAKLRREFEQAVEAIGDPPEGIFLRTEHVSLKYGIHGVGPYKKADWRKVVESLVSSSKGHECIRPNDPNCVLYVFPWIKEFEPDLEFRVFVYKNQVTAVSQQNLYRVNQVLKDKSDDEIRHEIMAPLLEYFNETVKVALADVGSYSMDFALIPQPNGGCSPYFIEINGFGAEYAAGSALFHWINDEAVLLGDGSSIEVRFNDRNNQESIEEIIEASTEDA
ncbi:hypothetical protein HDU81_004825 [Chytriomyces hyalinus]|nr:hypothetical protein HDU81_004825 [Chytriomyces hyalinus]